MDSTTGQRVLARAAAKIGGVAALAAHLEISRTALMAYITGGRTVPDNLFLRAIDVILEEEPAVLRAPPDTARPLAK